MRHRRAVRKLGRNTSARKALLRSLITNLIIHERISTTYDKAKEASSLADRLITCGKKNTITSKKNAISMLGSKHLIKKLCDDIAPRYANRAGGYTRVLQLMPRKGDGAKMAILELTERKIIEEKAAKKKGKARKGVPAEKKEPQAEKAPREAKGRAGKRPPEPKEAPHAPVPEATTKLSQEKVEEEKHKEKAKSEKEKLKKGFFKGLRHYFRRKSM